MTWLAKVRRILRDRGRGSIARLARDLRRSPRTLNNWLYRDLRPRSEAATQERVAEALEVDIAWLRDDTRGMPAVAADENPVARAMRVPRYAAVLAEVARELLTTARRSPFRPQPKPRPSSRRPYGRNGRSAVSRGGAGAVRRR